MRGFRFANGREKPVPEGLASDVVLRRDSIYRRSLAVSDMLAAGFAMALPVAVLAADRLAWPVALGPVTLVIAGKIMRLYDRDEVLLHKGTLDEAPALFQLATLYALVIWLADGWATHGILGREQVLAVWGLLFLCLLVGRASVRQLAARFMSVERCLVVGDADTADQVRRKLESSHSLNARYVGRVPLSQRDDDGSPALGSLSELGIVLMDHDVHRVIIAPGSSEPEAILDAVRLVKALGVKASVLPRLFEVVGSSVELDEVQGMPLLGLRRHGLSKSSQILKRIMDIAVSAAALFLLAPLLGLIALAVKLSSPGPVLFRQVRIGRNGREFEMLKFRTMVDGADGLKPGLMGRNEADGFFKIADDPRTTRLGRLLRRSALDELPQLVNVLRGEMSLVGPRPLVREDDARIEGWQRRRLGLTPGMTGVWQVLGSSRIPLHDMVKLDYLYAANWSMWLDAKILLRTVPFMLGRRGL